MTGVKLRNDTEPCLCVWLKGRSTSSWSNHFHRRLPYFFPPIRSFSRETEDNIFWQWGELGRRSGDHQWRQAARVRSGGGEKVSTKRNHLEIPASCGHSLRWGSRKPRSERYRYVQRLTNLFGKCGWRTISPLSLQDRSGIPRNGILRSGTESLSAIPTFHAVNGG